LLNLVLTRHRCCNRDSCPEFSKTDFRRMQKLPRISNLLRQICQAPKIVGKRISESSLAVRSSKWFFVSQNPNYYFPLLLDRFSFPDILITSNGIGFRNLRQILVFSVFTQAFVKAVLEFLEISSLNLNRLFFFISFNTFLTKHLTKLFFKGLIKFRKSNS
jgi:hypothetical protein